MRSAGLLWFKGEHFIFITLKMCFKAWYLEKKKRLGINPLLSLAASAIWLFRNSMCGLDLVKIDFEDPSSLM